MFYWARFNCDICELAGSYQGWCLCRKYVVDDFNYEETQMEPVFKSVIDPWHYDKHYWIFDLRIIKEFLCSTY